MISTKTYKKINSTGELERAHDRLTVWFNKFIVLRDLIRTESGRIYGVCIACKKELPVELFLDRSIMNGRKLHASHYFNSDRFASVRYYEDNLHLSCYNCNKNLHGSKEHYQPNLVKKIGEERFDLLVQTKNQIKHWNIIELDELTNVYRKKASKEADRLKIKI